MTGLAVPFNAPTEIRDGSGIYTETFRIGAFARTIAERGQRVKFLAHHQQAAMPLGRAVLLREDAAGLYGEFHVSKTVAGDEALELIRDGALDALSIAFTPIRDDWASGRRSVTRVEVRLHEVSAMTFGAYEDATITGLRTTNTIPPALSVEIARRRLDLILKGR